MSKLGFDDFVGNEQAVQKTLLLIDEARGDSSIRMPDLAFLGPSGHGKTVLSSIVANECDRKLLIINSTVIREPFQFRGLIIDLVDSATSGAIVLLDECHALSRKIQDNLLTATEHPRELHTSHKDQVFTDKLPQNLSFIFATTHAGALKPALLGRLETVEFLPYSTKEQLEMAIKYMERAYKIDRAKMPVECMIDIAKRSRSGRQVVKFCDTLIRYMKKNKQDEITIDVVEKCFEILGVDKYGLTRVDHIMLKHLCQMNTFVGLDTLDAIMPTDKKQIREHIEPFLLKQGFIIRTASGRMITPQGRKASKGV